MYPVIVSALLCVFIHISAFALMGSTLGVAVREVSYGFGPVLARLGRVTLKAIPLGGAVKFKDSREQLLDPSEMADALDGKPLAIQIAIGASGCIALLLIALATMGLEGLQAFADGFVQIIAGALSPLGRAQELLAQGEHNLVNLSFAAVLGLVAAKFAAVNMLPLPAANGGFILATIARHANLARHWPQQLTTALLLAYIAIFASWLCALVVYLWR